MGAREIKVGVIQTRTMPGTSREEKIAHLLPLIEKASEEGCQIILPPELYTTDYEKFYTKDPEYFRLAEPIPGPSTEAVGELTKKHGNYVIMPLFEKKAPGIYYNSAATVGNPHCVIHRERASEAEARRLGPLVETDPRFPNRTNVQFCQVLDRGTLRIEIWERGAGYTLASGTSGCAAAAVAHRLGLCGEAVSVQMPGGALAVEIAPDFQVRMTGPVGKVADGELSAEVLEDRD